MSKKAEVTSLAENLLVAAEELYSAAHDYVGNCDEDEKYELRQAAVKYAEAVKTVES